MVTLRGIAERVLPKSAIDAGLTVRAVRRAGHRLPLRHGFAHWVRAAHLNDLPPGLLTGPVVAVDVGAHVGEWTAAVLRLPQTQQVVVVEPTPDSVRELRQRFAGDPRVRVAPVAAGREAGTITLHLTTQSNFNSALPLRGDIDSMYDGVAETGAVEVPVATLDELLADVRRITLLKIDVQGLEPDVIVGATETLQRTDCILIELQFRSHYAGDALIWDLNPLLEAAGFSLFRLSPAITAPDGSFLWADGVYTRSTV